MQVYQTKRTPGARNIQGETGPTAITVQRRAADCKDRPPRLSREDDVWQLLQAVSFNYDVGIGSLRLRWSSSFIRPRITKRNYYRASVWHVCSLASDCGEYAGVGQQKPSIGPPLSQSKS